MYIIGGCDASFDQVEVFDLKNVSISTLKDLTGSDLRVPQPREFRYPCSVALPELNSIVITGGRTCNNSTCTGV